MPLHSVYFQQSKMIHLVNFWKEIQGWLLLAIVAISWRNGATSSNSGISSPVCQSQKSASFVFLPSCCSVKIAAKRELSVVSWDSLCLMKTFGHCRTLVLGQPVDTWCQELNGTPPSSGETRSEGRLHQYSLLTSLLDLWSTSCLFSTLAVSVKVLGRATYVTGRQRETGRETFSAVRSLVWSQRQWASVGLFEASGDQAQVRLYCREMDGSGTCCGRSLALKQ